MSDKDISLRSAIFVVIGILLSLSLVICIYVVNSERDLIGVDARVIYVKENIDGNGKNESTVTYRVNNINYEYSFYYKKTLKIDDNVKIYYHSKNPMSVQTMKTSYLIFVGPSIGLILCIVGIVGLFKRPKKEVEEDLFKTQVLEINGNTQKLEIITDDMENHEYVKSDEEELETPIKELVNKEKEVSNNDIVIEKRSNSSLEEEEESDEIDDDIVKDLSVDGKEISDKDDEQNVLEHYDEIFDEKNKINIDEYLLSKKKNDDVKVSLSKVIPKYYYVTGNTLVYEVYGQEAKELNLQDIKQVIRTINSEGTLIKVLVNTSNLSCILTNMNKVNLLEVSNLIHNKMLDLNIDYDEVVEYKEF